MADNLTTLMHQLSRNSGGLNLVEPYWPIQAYNGIPLPLPLLPLASSVSFDTITTIGWV